MNLYTHARKYIDVKDLRHLHEEKIKKRNIAEVEKQQEIILAELKKIKIETSPKFCNWRRELREGMTTGAMMSATLPPHDLASYTTDMIINQDLLNNDSLIPVDGTSRDVGGGLVWTMNNSPDPGSAAVVAGFNADLSRMDKLSVSVYFTNATIDTDGADVVIDGPPGSGLAQVIPLSAPGSGSGFVNHNANPTITIDPALRVKGAHVSFSFVGRNIGGTRQIGNNAVEITSCFPYRSQPMNVIVGLDDPEVVSFIRTDPTMRGLSAAQREKKLLEMLEAGDEYLLKQLGIVGSSARPEATKDPVSWEQSADEIDYGTDLTPLSDNPYGTEVAQVASTELAGMGINPDTATPSILAAVLGITMYAATELRKGLDTLQSVTGGFPNYGADAGPTTTGQPLPGVGENTPEQQKEIDAAGKELSDAQRALNDLPDNATDAQKDMAQERLDRATKNRTRLRKRNRSNRSTRNESVVYEKKKLKRVKDISKKIPGYYDGKPAPTGFPMDEPPKMVNGFHPDLIDGKRVADRFNKMDPISARSMPATGNPHIDKKVKASAKKPK